MADEPVFGLDDRLPPHAPDLEDAILGGLLIDGESFHRVSGLQPEHFYLHTNRTLFGAMCDLALNDKPIDLMTVTMRLSDLKQLDEIGGRGKLADLYEASSGSAAIDLYAEMLIAKWRRREMISRCRDLMALAHRSDVDEPTLQSSMDSQLLSLFASSGTKLTRLDESMMDSYASLEAHEATGSSPIISTGYQSLDDVSGGVLGGQLIIVAGRPSMGKSAFAISGLTRNIAQERKLPCLVFSVEMSCDQLVNRIWSAELQNPYPLRVKKMGQGDWVDLGRVISQLSGLPIYLDDTPGMGLAHIQSVCRQTAARLGQLGCVTIDYLQILDDPDDDSNANRSLGKITKRLKKLARELNTPIFLLSQLNRGVESRQDKRPLMSDLRESGSIEQDSDMVMMLYRDEYYDANTVDRGVAEVIVRKNRDGPLGTAKLLFEPSRSRFLDLL